MKNVGPAQKDDEANAQSLIKTFHKENARLHVEDEKLRKTKLEQLEKRLNAMGATRKQQHAVEEKENKRHNETKKQATRLVGHTAHASDEEKRRTGKSRETAVVRGPGQLFGHADLPPGFTARARAGGADAVAEAAKRRAADADAEQRAAQAAAVSATRRAAATRAAATRAAAVRADRRAAAVRAADAKRRERRADNVFSPISPTAMNPSSTLLMPRSAPAAMPQSPRADSQAPGARKPSRARRPGSTEPNKGDPRASPANAVRAADAKRRQSRVDNVVSPTSGSNTSQKNPKNKGTPRASPANAVRAADAKRRQSRVDNVVSPTSGSNTIQKNPKNSLV